MGSLTVFLGSVLDDPSDLKLAKSDWDIGGLFFDLSTVVNYW